MKIPGLKGFIAYILEREAIRLRKMAGEPWPWTEDKILQTYKFTNVRRLHDKTTQAFKEIYDLNAPHGSFVDCLMNAATFRYFGTRRWASIVGWQQPWKAKYTLHLAHSAMDAGDVIFTGAYVITNGGRHGRKEDVVVEYLTELAKQAHYICDVMEGSKRWQRGAEAMYRLPGFGGTGFMTKEVLQDYLLMWPGKYLEDASTWTPVGDGGRRGINRLYGRPLLQNLAKKQGWLEEILAVRDNINAAWHKPYPAADSLTAHDIQFCLCEWDKFERTRLGQGRPRGLYRPPEQRHLRNGIEIA